jgi:hypothetical protein
MVLALVTLSGWSTYKDDHNQGGGNVGGHRGPAGHKVVLSTCYYIPQVPLQYKHPNITNSIDSNPIQNH